MSTEDPSARSAAAHGIGIAHPTVVPDDDEDTCPACGQTVEDE